MHARDYLKAVALALPLLIANMAIAFVAVYVYARFIAPGQSHAFYGEIAPRIAAWTAPLGGTTLFFLVGNIGARRNPDRNAMGFVGATFAAYALVDVALGAAAGGRAAVLDIQLALSLSAALLGGLVGAALGAAGSSPRARHCAIMN